MYILEDTAIKDKIIVTSYKIKNDKVFFGEIVKILNTGISCEDGDDMEVYYSSEHKFASVEVTIITDLGNDKIGRILYG